jgi:cyclophilin family peptidyl-prolyl cis-trans isomerase
MPNQPRTRFVILVAIVALLAASCSGTAAVAANHGGTTTTAATGSVPDITLPPVPPGTYSAPDDLGLDPSAPIAATIATSCGDIVISLDPAAAPATVNSFVFLATAGYFDGTVFHRILPGFVVQAGDPTATGRGGPGYTVPDELPSIGFHYGRGVVAMANAGPDTGGSQFFIVLADTGLEANYTVFGEVEDGFDTLDRIAAVPLGTNPFGERSVPLETVYIESVTIER